MKVSVISFMSKVGWTAVGKLGARSLREVPTRGQVLAQGRSLTCLVF